MAAGLPPLSMQITKSLVRLRVQCLLTGCAGAVNRFDPGNLQQVTRHRPTGNLLSRLGQGNNDFALQHERHLRLAHLIGRAIGKADAKGLERTLAESLLDRFWSHDFIPNCDARMSAARRGERPLGVLRKLDRAKIAVG